MKQTLKVKNVKCGGCAGTLKKALFEVFGEVEVNLDVEPREITSLYTPVVNGTKLSKNRQEKQIKLYSN